MPSRRSAVLFHVPARGVRRGELREFARNLQDDVAGGRAFVCLITADSDLQRWNAQYRGKNYATDVLSFPAENGDAGLGEMAVSFDRAQAQAAEAGHGAQDEIRILMLHGVLHLTGLDHETDRGEMARAERRWRKHYGLPAGLIERVHG